MSLLPRCLCRHQSCSRVYLRCRTRHPVLGISFKTSPKNTNRSKRRAKRRSLLAEQPLNSQPRPETPRLVRKIKAIRANPARDSAPTKLYRISPPRSPAKTPAATRGILLPAHLAPRRPRRRIRHRKPPATTPKLTNKVATGPKSNKCSG